MKKRCALITLLGSLVATTAFAQQPPPGPSVQTGDPRKDARMHLGPFHLTPAVVVNNVGVDTNVFNQAGEQKSDFTATLVPQVTIWTPISNRALITTSLSNGVTYYKTYSNQSSLDPAGSIQANVGFHRLTLFGAETYAQSRQRPNYEIDVRVPQTMTGTQVGFSYKLGPRDTIEMSAHRDHSSYGTGSFFLGESLRLRLNKVQQGVRLRVARQLTSLTAVHVLVENIQDKFVFSPERDAAGVRVAAGASFGRRALISGEAEVGFRTMKPVDPEVESFSGLVAKTGLTYQRRGATQVRLEWNRDVQFSYDAVRSYYVLNGATVTFRRQLAGRFDGILAAGQTRSSYVKVVVLSGNPLSTTTKVLKFDLGYRLTRDTRLGFAIAREWRTSNPPTGRDYAAIKAGMSFNVGF